MVTCVLLFAKINNITENNKCKHKVRDIFLQKNDFLTINHHLHAVITRKNMEGILLEQSENSSQNILLIAFFIVTLHAKFLLKRVKDTIP